MDDKVVVCGAGGFVGGKLVKFLREKGFHDIVAASSRSVDRWLYVDPSIENLQVDLREYRDVAYVLEGATWVYNLAAKVGGIGYIGAKQADCFSSVAINANILRYLAERPANYFFASSACVYGSSATPAKETDEPHPSVGYGDEKLFSEKMCLAYHQDYGVPVNIGRYHTIYGPGDDIKGSEGKDHVPSALCRKIIHAKLSGVHELTIWGDGTQTRDYVYVDDIVEGTYRLMTSGGPSTPVNVGTSEVISVDQLVDILEDIAGVKVQRFYDTTAPKGVQSRGCDTSLLREITGWEPTTKVKDGMRALYNDLWNKIANR